MPKKSQKQRAAEMGNRATLARKGAAKRILYKIIKSPSDYHIEGNPYAQNSARRHGKAAHWFTVYHTDTRTFVGYCHQDAQTITSIHTPNMGKEWVGEKLSTKLVELQIASG